MSAEVTAALGRPGESLIGRTMVIRGSVTSGRERLTIMGTVEGTVDHDRSLTIHRTGRVTGDIRAEEVLVEGTVDGTIHASRWLRIAPTGRVNGAGPSAVERAGCAGNAQTAG